MNCYITYCKYGENFSTIVENASFASFIDIGNGT